MKRLICVLLMIIILSTTEMATIQQAQADVTQTTGAAVLVSAICAVALILKMSGLIYAGNDDLYGIAKKTYDNLSIDAQNSLNSAIMGGKKLYELGSDLVGGIIDKARDFIGTHFSAGVLDDLKTVDTSKPGDVIFGGTLNIVETYLGSGLSFKACERSYDSSTGKYIIHYIGDGVPDELDEIDMPAYNYTQVTVKDDGNIHVTIVFGTNGTSFSNFDVDMTKEKITFGDEVIADDVDVDEGDTSIASDINTSQVAADIVEDTQTNMPLYPPDTAGQWSGSYAPIATGISNEDALNETIDNISNSQQTVIDTGKQQVGLLQSILTKVSSIFDSVKSIASVLTTGLIGDFSNINIDQWKISADLVKQKFPFSLPWDLYYSIQGINSDSGIDDFSVDFVAPDQTNQHKASANVPFSNGNYNVLLSYMPTIRTVFIIIIIIALIYLTPNLLGGAK